MLREELARSENARDEVSQEYDHYRLKAQQWEVRRALIVNQSISCRRCKNKNNIGIAC